MAGRFIHIAQFSAVQEDRIIGKHTEKSVLLWHSKRKN